MNSMGSCEESAQIIGKTYRQAAAAKFLILIAAATSVNALELGGLIELGTSELSLLWGSFNDHVWLSAMSPSSRVPAPAAGLRFMRGRILLATSAPGGERMADVAQREPRGLRGEPSLAREMNPER